MHLTQEQEDRSAKERKVGHELHRSYQGATASMTQADWEAREAELRSRLLASDISASTPGASASTPGATLPTMQQQERQRVQAQQAQQADVQQSEAQLKQEEEEQQQQQDEPDWGGDDVSRTAEPATADVIVVVDDGGAEHQAGAFRREGLPCRVLVDRKGERNLQGGVDLQVDCGESGVRIGFLTGQTNNSGRSNIFESRELEIEIAVLRRLWLDKFAFKALI